VSLRCNTGVAAPPQCHSTPSHPRRNSSAALLSRAAFFLRSRVIMDPLQMLNSLEAGVAAVAPGWRVTSWSPSAARLTGKSADEVLGAELWAAFPALRRVAIEGALEAVLADGVARTVQLPGRSSEVGGAMLEIEACRAADSHLLLLIRPAARTSADPADQAAQVASDAEGRLYSRLFEVLPTPALILAPDGRMVQANAAAAGLLGVPSATRLRGRSLTEWVRTPEFPAALASVRAAPVRLTVAVEIPGGEAAREAQVILTATDPDQEQSRILCLAVDVSREILLQRRLVKADRLSQLGALVSGVAHELNNPLAAIAAFAELLTENVKDPATAESAGIIHAEAIRAGRMIRTLLDFARQQSRTLQAVALPDVVDRVLALQRSALQKARITTSVAFGSQLPSLRGDPRELQQVLLNAVVNARQAIQDKGGPGKITIHARQSDHHVVVSVEDTGTGVPPEVLERVFEPFYTTKGEEGTGLGLSISSGLISDMGGRMWLQNVDGSGARLSFELPIDTTVAAQAAPTRARKAIRPMSVLIVEDQVPVRRGIQLMAERLGHHPVVVGGAREALDRLEKGEETLDALLVDVHLEDGHTGFEVFEALVQEGKGREQLVIFTTGDSISPQTRDRIERADRPVLRKPFSLDELRVILDRLA
jgi:signal transduction histidine kinase